ncbi:DOMON-like domain-containing protein [Sphingomonas sp. DG1-23]|uniref:DOMON-like domain-containing protein n=1 Tax=Sphingomonas sp. DG1-23 TaxID=3068316 RepID=UPI00273E2DE8|nr:DOMON-like domain-containing protein [Sphingomonas sp. DG1-23]MDP5278174.1 DOMON-like domain-containing protein [Sphingomonas sp. DG1-23]
MGRGLGNGTLVPHPDFEPVAVRGIEVMLACGGDGRWLIEYRVEGGGDLVAPGIATPRRADELWKHTCFELFVRPEGSDAYYEFNFSPSGEWAAYRFTGYRAGMADLPLGVPAIEWWGGEMRAAVDLSGLPDGDWCVGVTAVIEEAGGKRSFWSLAHPPGKPDFHHEANFAWEVPAAA